LPSSSVYHRDLHSFPTRRSSDLQEALDEPGSLAGHHDADQYNDERAEQLETVVHQVADDETVNLLQAGQFSFHQRASSSRPSARSEEHTSELQSRENLVCRLLLE